GTAGYGLYTRPQGSVFISAWGAVHRGNRRSDGHRPRLGSSPMEGRHMRESYFEELEDIRHCLVELANTVGSQMSTATTALLDADVALADLVIAGDEQIDATRESIDQRCFTLLARQQPVATDLRTIGTGPRIRGG